MRCSLNEIEALSLKAARGAGLPWGVAQEAAWAVRWLAAQAAGDDGGASSSTLGQDGVAALGRTLAAVDGQPCASLFPALDGGGTGRAYGLFAGIALSDAAPALDAPLCVPDVAEPLLLVPFAAGLAASAGQPLELEWRGAACQVTAETIADGADGAWPPAAAVDAVADLTLRAAPGTPGAPPPAALQPGGGVVVDQEAQAVLAAFADRTYVPESAQSRRRGAGGDRIDDE